MQRPGKADVKKRVKACPNHISPGCPRGPSLTKGIAQRVSLRATAVVVDRVTAVDVTSSSCSPLLLRVHVLNQRLLIAEHMAKPSGWHLLQFRSWPLRGSAISVHAGAISPHASEPSDINPIPLRTHRLEICSESDHFPGICSWSRGCAEERLHSAVGHNSAQTALSEDVHARQAMEGISQGIFRNSNLAMHNQ